MACFSMDIDDAIALFGDVSINKQFFSRLTTESIFHVNTRWVANFYESIIIALNWMGKE